LFHGRQRLADNDRQERIATAAATAAVTNIAIMGEESRLRRITTSTPASERERRLKARERKKEEALLNKSSLQQRGPPSFNPTSTSVVSQKTKREHAQLQQIAEESKDSDGEKDDEMDDTIQRSGVPKSDRYV
jgi:hypothetical protein